MGQVVPRLLRRDDYAVEPETRRWLHLTPCTELGGPRCREWHPKRRRLVGSPEARRFLEAGTKVMSGHRRRE